MSCLLFSQKNILLTIKLSHEYISTSLFKIKQYDILLIKALMLSMILLKIINCEERKDLSLVSYDINELLSLLAVFLTIKDCLIFLSVLSY